MKKMFAILLVALALAGCGGTKAVSRQVDMSDFAFSPAQLLVPAGSEVSLTINNKGALEHNFILMSAGSQVEAPWSDESASAVYAQQSNIPAGDSVTLTFTAPMEPGEYQVLCSVPAHLEQGMQATLIVE